MSKKYIIRRVDFAYNDEFFLTNDKNLGKIQQIYPDYAEAFAAYQALVVDELQQVDLEMYDFGYGYADEDVYQAVEKLVLEKTGEAYDKDDGLPNLATDDLFEFAQLTGIVHYQLLEIDDQMPFYLIWLPIQQDYLRDYDSDAILSGAHAHFIQDHPHDWYFFDQLTGDLHGSLAQLSDAPQLLQQVIQTHRGMAYDDVRQTLCLVAHEAGYDGINALNGLLKQPLFEIQQKNLEQLYVLNQ